MAVANEVLNIQIDPEALRNQVQGVIDPVIRNLAWNLRNAADELDPAYQTWIQEQLKDAYDRGLADGKH